MKPLADLLPVLLFFAAYKLYDLYLATAVLMGATALQTGAIWLWKRRVETAQKVALLLVLLFGGATLLLHDELYIKWKPTAINLLFGLAFLLSQLTGKPLVQRMLEGRLELPEKVWRRLNLLWSGFFFFVAGANLAVLSLFSTEVWVNFKLFGLLGLTLLFLLLQALYLSRYLRET